MNKSPLTPCQTDVLKAFYEYGEATDVGIATYIHHSSDGGWSSSGIRTRRSEIEFMGFVECSGSKTMPSGREACIYQLSDHGVVLARTLFGRVPVAA